MRAALLPVLLLLGTSATATAEGLYAGYSLGGSSVGNELGEEINDALRVRFAVGYRLNKRWAVEGFVGGDIGTASHFADRSYAASCGDCGGGTQPPPYQGYGSSSSLTTIGVDVKYLHPLSEKFEVYLRGSLGKGWLDNSDYSGRGFGIGAGAQIKGKVRALGFLFWPLFFVPWGPKVTAALYADAGSDFYRLHRHGHIDNPDSIDGSINRFTIGWAVGTDF
ncbi:MAG: outer membrane beta-barrel protein [Kofleriaceae bacterium]